MVYNLKHLSTNVFCSLAVYKNDDHNIVVVQQRAPLVKVNMVINSNNVYIA